MDQPQEMQAYFNETHLQPLAAVMLVLLGIAMLSLPRRYALLPMIVMACFVSQAQRIAVAGLNFDLLRVLVLVGWARVVARGEWRGFQSCRIDWWLVAWMAYGFVTTMLLHATAEAAKNRLGITYQAMGMYFLFRVLIRNWEDVHTLAIGLAVAAVPVAAMFLFEHATRRNLFAVFGGVSAITGERSGRLRCQGAFSHPILAGCFWAAVMPLMAMQWWRGGPARWWGLIGLAASMVIIVMCASSTPLSAVAVGGLGMAMFPLRKRLRLVRWGIVVTLVVLHLSMNAPVWHLVSRMDLAGGSTGWHRFHLIDAFVHHFSEWCLIGRADYMAGWGWGLWDVTNFYIMQGLQGGVVLMTLFVGMIACAFASVGRIVHAQDATPQGRFAWALGVCLLIHAINFLAVTYFGQIVMIWYLVLATIGSASAMRAPAARRWVVRYRPRPVRESAPVPALGGAVSYQ